MCESSDSGYTAGIAQFNTKDGSALKVVDKYKDGSNYQDEFEAVYAALEKAAKDKSASTDGLTDFCDAWTTAAGNGNAFYSAQVAVARSMLEKNAKQSTWTIGLKYPLSKSLMMLTAFSNGYGKDGSTLGGIIAAADKKFDADTPGDSGNTLKIGEYSVDEMEWVKAFLDAKDELSGDSSSKQSDVIRNIIKGGYYKFNQSFKVKGINGKSVSFTCGNPTTSN
ncbi:hypothetical protein LPJ61_006246 [Coemansia biformis]|uniref:Chitosanase n=1 Tax=Coemansia biformis TaxID=1286918 RepID=A0A9W7XUY4_9FUNG|nr:hypothetical protein LPJ61_006246 [Coemansia biformis]